ncbi:hypothetical protein VMCG_09690 [Cytospora schulzeri]|uniref:ATPase AAA-type core domain-containing protein n=1 Tax=Cytospora schulzeri TaxID=448051 RepID=A0A423VK15_9PEZI|nr:hypothetical protein VMCG_09690 [Valsa malicola]
MALFGPTYGYVDNEEGAPLNSFLAMHAGERCVVFLDEFEKTSSTVHNSLLKVMDTGYHRDRRSGPSHGEQDFSRVIWVLATNVGDTEIQDFHSSRKAGRKDEDVEKVSLKPLQDDLAQTFSLRFSSAVAGRIDLITPFFPFSTGE